MAVRITCSDASASIVTSGKSILLKLSNLTTNINVSFDGAGSGSSMYGSWYDYIKIVEGSTEQEFKTTSKSVSIVPSNFEGVFSYMTAKYIVVGQSNALAGTKLQLGDVYFNGNKIDTADTVTGLDSAKYSIYIWPNGSVYKPKFTNFDNITIRSGGWNGFPIANATTLQISNISYTSEKSDDPTTYISCTITSYNLYVGNAEITAYSVDGNNTKVSKIVTPTSEETSYVLTISATLTNTWGGTATMTKSITIYPYHLPRLVLNKSGAVSYVSRCQQNGSADGLGTYGHLHLVWDVSKINTTGSGTVNTLQSATVVLNGGTTLSPSGGSISTGYLDYIFPLALETQGNLSITLKDTRKTNTITGLNVPKGSMPLSLYDDGSNIGISFGCMATEKGAWVYMPFYLQSSTSGSTKMFRICVYDDGTIKAVAV